MAAQGLVRSETEGGGSGSADGDGLVGGSTEAAEPLLVCMDMLVNIPFTLEHCKLCKFSCNSYDDLVDHYKEAHACCHVKAQCHKCGKQV